MSRARLTLEECYRDLLRGETERATADQTLSRRHWIHGAAELDERTGEMLASSLGVVTARLHDSTQRPLTAPVEDRLHRIVEHSRRALREILPRLHEGIVREHASLPVQAVRELDSASFFALSRRPGRTIREKLADKPHLWAVKRRWTVDTAENRLLKAFCVRIGDLLRTRALCLPGHDEPELVETGMTIDSWLRSPSANEIGRWENLPPNNLLLQHRDYRRIWDAWLWTQSLDEDLQRDHDDRVAQWTTIAFWSVVSQLASSDGVRLLEQPCYPDYEAFTIVPGRTGDAVQAHVEGLFIAPSSGKSRGVVSSLGQNKRKEGTGTLALADGSSAFFHSGMFDSPAEFAALRIGTVLMVNRVDLPHGKVWATNPVVLTPPGAFRVEMTGGSRVVLVPPSGAPVEITFQDDGHRVRARVGAKTSDAEMSLTAIHTIAESALRAAFGARHPISVGGASATAHTTSTTVVDLCSLRPRFAEDDRSGQLPFRLLWQAWHPQGREPVDITPGTARAIALRTDVISVSILDLLAAEPVPPVAVLSRAARSFTEKLRSALTGDSIIYIVPDSTDEFALATLRRSLNAAFRVAEPLPRSIGAVFAWQSSAAFAASGLADGDCVIVLDTIGEMLSATPLFARKKAELLRCLPESAGFSWERRPCVQSGTTTSTAAAAGVLKALDSKFAADVARLAGLQGLVDEGAEVSWQNEAGRWYTAPANQDQIIRSATQRLEDPWAGLNQGLEQEIGQLPRGARVFILVIGDVFRAARRRIATPEVCRDREVIQLDHDHEPHLGGLALHRWQLRAGHIPLWRDHLPDLSVRLIHAGRHPRFFLVKDANVAPRRGHAIPIKIVETFVLPAGRPDYRFPLLQGAGGSALRYEVFLRSSAFPLEHDLEVALCLTYTYGSDMPYDLLFKPVVETPQLSFVRAEWRLRADADDLPAHYPTPPSSLPWSHLTRYPKRDSSETRDLLQWIRGGIERLDRRAAGLHSLRRTGVVLRDPALGRLKLSRYVHAQSEGETVFCHELDFIDSTAIGALRGGDSLTFNVEPGDKGPRGRAITVSSDAVSEDRSLEHLTWGLADDMKRALRFPFLIVWSEGRELADPRCPPDFRELMQHGATILLSLHENRRRLGTESAHMIADEALFLLCCMHADAPPAAADALREVFSSRSVKRLRRHCRHIALALGACRLDWQRDLLANVISILRSETARSDVHSLCLGILGNAVWRCGDALEALSNRDLTTIIHRSILVLEETHDLIESRRQGWSPMSLKDHLELVLGLLRTRAAEDPERRGILAPRMPATKALARVIENILDSVAKHHIPIHSRLSLAVEKPPELSNTPELLYALKLYLTGDDGALAIRVVEIREDDREDA